eukprot:NODE_166_length_16344_cov_0.418775.p9 type:complete len:125 gc:universal NODE_166_length_16344_cov_0.418775:3519-3145(-)
MENSKTDINIHCNWYADCDKGSELPYTRRYKITTYYGYFYYKDYVITYLDPITGDVLDQELKDKVAANTCRLVNRGDIDDRGACLYIKKQPRVHRKRRDAWWAMITVGIVGTIIGLANLCNPPL